jgi:hypothetical protein
VVIPAERLAAAAAALRARPARRRPHAADG